MRNILHRFLLFGILMGFGTLVWGQSSGAKWIIEEGPEKDDPKLNEFVHIEKVRLEIYHPKDKLIVWPTFKDSLGGFEILEAGSVDTLSQDEKSITKSQVFLLFATGKQEVKLPEVQVKSLEEEGELSISAAGTYVNVATQPIDTTQEVRQIKDIQAVPVSVSEWLPWVLIALVSIGIIVFAVWYYRKRKNGEKVSFVPPPPQIPAHEIAMRDLAKLEAKKHWQNGYVKEYYVELTDIIRNYIEKRFHLPALESISDEIMEDLRQEKLKPNMLEGISDLLVRADLAKFAKSQPDPGENLASIDFARSFVKETKKMLTRKEESEQQAQNEGKEEETA